MRILSIEEATRSWTEEKYFLSHVKTTIKVFMSSKVASNRYVAAVIRLPEVASQWLYTAAVEVSMRGLEFA